MKRTDVVMICLTLYLMVFTHGCWNTVNSSLNLFDRLPSATPVEKIEKPILQEELPQLFIIPTPQLQEHEVTADDGKPNLFAEK